MRRHFGIKAERTCESVNAAFWRDCKISGTRRQIGLACRRDAIYDHRR